MRGDIHQEQFAHSIYMHADTTIIAAKRVSKHFSKHMVKMGDRAFRALYSVPLAMLKLPITPLWYLDCGEGKAPGAVIVNGSSQEI